MEVTTVPDPPVPPSSAAQVTIPTEEIADTLFVPVQVCVEDELRRTDNTPATFARVAASVRSVNASLLIAKDVPVALVKLKPTTVKLLDAPKSTVLGRETLAEPVELPVTVISLTVPRRNVEREAPRSWLSTFV